MRTRARTRSAIVALTALPPLPACAAGPPATPVTHRASPARAAPVPLHTLVRFGPPIVLDTATRATTASPLDVAVAVSAPPAAATPSPGVYEVQPGDSYWRITEHHT